MRISHRIATIPNEEERAAFLRFGIDLPVSRNVEVFVIEDDDPRWNGISQILPRFRLHDQIQTTFSKDELKNARYLDVSPSWHFGYPLPEDDFGYFEATYDLTGFCKTCFTGAKQNAPFRMRKEPVWGRRSIMQMNWVFDEYFVKTDSYHSVFEPLGIPCLPVLKNKSDSELTSVVQMAVTARVELEMDNLPYEICQDCFRRRYVTANAGFYPKPTVSGDMPAIRSTQIFGSGGASHNRIMIANNVYEAILTAGLKGAEYGACAD